MGEVLTGADVTENDVTFQYTEQKLSGAKYNVYAAEDIKTPSGNLIYKKGTLLAENLTTDASGSVTLPGLHLGSYSCHPRSKKRLEATGFKLDPRVIQHAMSLR